MNPPHRPLPLAAPAPAQAGGLNAVRRHRLCSFAQGLKRAGMIHEAGGFSCWRAVTTKATPSGEEMAGNEAVLNRQRVVRGLPVWAGLMDEVEELLRLAFHIEANILMLLVARDTRDALQEIEDRCRRMAFIGEYGIDDLRRFAF